MIRKILWLLATFLLGAMYQTRQFFDDGALMGCGVSYGDCTDGRQLMSTKLIKGANPADLPWNFP